MSDRRKFIKTAGFGLAAAGLTGCAKGPAIVEKAEDSYATAIRTKGIRTLEKIQLKVKAPLLVPYNSQSKKEESRTGYNFFRSEAFIHNPFTIKCGGISGSPIIMDAEGKFVGFMTTFGYQDSLFEFDGKETLTVHVPEGQELYIDESGKGDEAWKAYNSEMFKRLNFKPFIDVPEFWKDVEYCTWVEQKIQSKVRGGHFKMLSHNFIEKYIDKLNEFGYPKGKLTLDHGWGIFPDGTVESGFGSWHPDPNTFTNFHKTMDMIRDKGFTPGLWVAFPKVHHNSTIAKKYPDILGNWNVNKPSSPTAERWLNPKADIYEYASEVIDRFYQMGVMKFKIDMSYNTKADMIHIHKELYRAAKAIDNTIEMEFHVPDIFFAKHADVIRTNDIWMDEERDWPSRVKMHYEVSVKSCPGRGINLDHIGGNDTHGITEEGWLKHLAMYENKIGYPLVSVLPHHFSQKCVDKTGEYLWNYHKNGREIISDFYVT